jgi:hypothetical protein
MKLPRRSWVSWRKYVADQRSTPNRRMPRPAPVSAGTSCGTRGAAP